MKKLITVITAVVLLLAVGITAFAVDPNDTVTDISANTEIPVTASVQINSGVAVTNRIVIVYSDLHFVYTFREKEVWDSENAKYDISAYPEDTDRIADDTHSGWNATAAYVRITNESNQRLAIQLTIGSSRPESGVAVDVTYQTSAQEKYGEYILHGIDEPNGGNAIGNRQITVNLAISGVPDKDYFDASQNERYNGKIPIGGITIETHPEGRDDYAAATSP